MWLLHSVRHALCFAPSLGRAPVHPASCAWRHNHTLARLPSQSTRVESLAHSVEDFLSRSCYIDSPPGEVGESAVCRVGVRPKGLAAASTVCALLFCGGDAPCCTEGERKGEEEVGEHRLPVSTALGAAQHRLCPLLERHGTARRCQRCCVCCAGTSWHAGMKQLCLPTAAAIDENHLNDLLTRHQVGGHLALSVTVLR